MIPDRNKARLYGPFAQALERFEMAMRGNALPFYLFEGLRTFERQAELYAQGRDTPGKIVTNARPGYSWHAYGMAADYVLDEMPGHPGVQWSWNLKADLNADGRSDWQQMAEIARNCGLEPGWYWEGAACDPPHVQQRYGLTIDFAFRFYVQEGLGSVWKKADEWRSLWGGVGI